MSTFNQPITAVNNENIEDKDFPYLPPCMKCQPIIDFTSIRFHNDKIEYPVKIFNSEESEYRFGILDIQIRTEIPITKKHIHMFFTIDASGSMNDKCSDGRTKMDHIHHTLENMLRIFHENKETNISVHVQSFDTTVKTIISNVPDIRKSDITNLIYLVRQIRPAGSTNIELALKNATEEILKYSSNNLEDEIVHIFLTDGDITDGSNNYNLLLKLVPKNSTNIFIGYGNDHDSQLLSHLSTKKGDEYRFIDALEKAGLVYGEIIHGLLYKAIEDVTLTAINGELYDYQTNTWPTSLQIGNLSSEQLKTYHVRSKNTANFHVSMFGKTIVKTRQFQTINIYDVQADIRPILIDALVIELNVYIFRQKTQELLYKARKISEKFKRVNTKINPMIPFDDIVTDKENLEVLKEQNKSIKQELSDFYTVMLNYIKYNQLENDTMFKMLCDDVYIAYKTTGTSLGNMYTTARQTSNGRQQTYMCSASHSEDIYESRDKPTFPRPIKLRRETNQNIFTFQEDLATSLSNDIESYNPTQDFLSPFSSDGVVTLMRAVSGNNSLGQTNDNNNLDDVEATIKIN